MPNPTILIIDDEIQIRRLLTITLTSNNYFVEEASTATSGIAAVANRPPDLILLDLGLPDESGHEVLRHLREWFTNPIIILSVQNDGDDITRALDNGANDYVVKPFRTGDLLSRIASAIRKSKPENSSVMIFNDLTIDFASRTVKKNNTAIALTPVEYSTLSLFARNEGKVLTHQFILKHMSTDQDQVQYLKIFIAELRKKIEDNPNRPIHILTEPGVGYRFVSHDPSPAQKPLGR